MKHCFARLRLRRLAFFDSDEIDVAINKINQERFDGLFTIDYNKPGEMWSVTGTTWLNWIDFKIWFHLQRVVWQHQDDIFVTEWVVFTLCHKVVRLLDPNAKYRDESDNFLSEVDFDRKFPTIDAWLRQLNLVSGDRPDTNISEVRSRTPDCFWQVR